MAAPASPGNLDLTIMSGGQQRAAHVHIPTGYDGTKPTPVLLNFHGRMTTAADQELISGTTPKADKAGFIVVYPSGIGETWNAGLCCGDAMSMNIDDVGFTRDLLDTLESKLCVDKKRVFSTGLSNGAFMSDRLGCELSDRIAAIAPVAGQLLTTTCSQSRPMPVIEFHGTSDPIVSYTGAVGMPSVEDAVKGWAMRNGCGTTPMQTYSMGDATCNTYSGCMSNADVTLCTIQDGGHTWPGGFPIPGLGKTSTSINATDAMWDFFSKHAMP
jgi:polyhydroxybutyrate depolymerase